jgi:hypothetical protein
MEPAASRALKPAEPLKAITTANRDLYFEKRSSKKMDSKKNGLTKKLIQCNLLSSFGPKTAEGLLLRVHTWILLC